MKRRIWPAALLLALGSAAAAGELHDFKVDKPLLSSRAPAVSIESFVTGVNYPWFNYGTDFGATTWGYHGVAEAQTRAAVSADFDLLASKGVKTVRWFVFCDGRAGLEYDQNGLVTGVPKLFYADMDAALDIAQRHGIRLILVLFDFHIFDKAEMVNGVSTGGRGRLITDARIIDSLFANALEPILGKYGRHPAILAWEIMNEPESGDGPLDAVYAFAQRAAVEIHARARQPITLGSNRRGNLKRWKGVGLDLYQFHYYDFMLLTGERLDVPYASLGLDKPCLLGEFPTAGNFRDPQTYLQTMKADGYAGALAWSLRGADRYSGFISVADKFAAWVRSH